MWQLHFPGWCWWFLVLALAALFLWTVAKIEGSQEDMGPADRLASTFMATWAAGVLWAVAIYGLSWLTPYVPVVVTFG
jgi:hypothetical protein